MEAMLDETHAMLPKDKDDLNDYSFGRIGVYDISVVRDLWREPSYHSHIEKKLIKPHLADPALITPFSLGCHPPKSGEEA
jgi:hypothetical protein